MIYAEAWAIGHREYWMCARRLEWRLHRNGGRVVMVGRKNAAGKGDLSSPESMMWSGPWDADTAARQRTCRGGDDGGQST